MNLLLVLGIAIALAMDAFAVSLGISAALKGIKGKHVLRVSFCFGFFQFIMPIIGWSVGGNLRKYIQAFDHWIAFCLLLFIGGKMIYESFALREKRERFGSDPTKGFSLLLLSVATSIDALGVGFSLAFLKIGIIYPALIIGLVAFVMTVFGMKLGSLAGHLTGKRAELVGGVILIIIGAVILAEHL